MHNPALCLISSDNKNIYVSRGAINLSVTLKNLVLDTLQGDDIEIPVEIAANVLVVIVKYMESYAHLSEQQIKEMEDEVSKSRPFIYKNESEDNYVSAEDKLIIGDNIELLFSIATAADMLEITALLCTTSKHIANILKNKTILEMRTIFNCINDYSPEEEKTLAESNELILKMCN